MVLNNCHIFPGFCTEACGTATRTIGRWYFLDHSECSWCILIKAEFRMMQHDATYSEQKIWTNKCNRRLLQVVRDGSMPSSFCRACEVQLIKWLGGKDFQRRLSLEFQPGQHGDFGCEKWADGISLFHQLPPIVFFSETGGGNVKSFS